MPGIVARLAGCPTGLHPASRLARLSRDFAKRFRETQYGNAVATDGDFSVNRCRDTDMALRWTATAFLEAAKSFRRIQGHRDVWVRTGLQLITLTVDENVRKPANARDSTR